MPALTKAGSPVGGVAKRLGGPQDSGYRLIEARGLPAHKVGPRWNFKFSAGAESPRAVGVGAGEGPASNKPAKTKRGRS